MRPADVFWAAVPVVAVVHNAWAADTDREQLSQAMDRYRSATPWAEIVIWLTAGHLSRRLPPWADPWHWISAVVNRRGIGYVLGGLAVAQGAVYVALRRAPDSLAESD